MAFDTEQKQIVRGSALACLVTVIVLGAGYLWLPSVISLGSTATVGERIAFTLKADLIVFLWLAGCVRAVSGFRFSSPSDRKGSAYGPPSTKLAVRIAILQNSLEQTVLAVGAHLILATALRGSELTLILLLVLLYILGRVTFAVSYPKGAGPRAFGMALTGTSTIAGFVLAAILIIVDR